MPNDSRLEQLLGGPLLAGLRRKLRAKFEREGSPPRIRIDGLNAEEERALASIVGRPSRGARSMALDVEETGRTLRRAGIADSLHAALVALEGPIVDRSAERERERAAWTTLARSAANGRLHAWLQSPASVGLVKRLAGGVCATAEALCRDVSMVLDHLPANGEPRARLAARLLGDAHALDGGRSIATVTLAVVRGTTPDSADDERARQTWARVGVLVNELARPALVLNLPGAGAGGEPTYLALRSLVRASGTWDLANQRVFVCENPNLVAIAADEVGIGSAPLVCTEGMPAAAQRTLLDQLVRSGAELWYHGDFDWPGLHIANHVIASYAARPWRMNATDYREATHGAMATLAPLRGVPVDACWDGDVSAAMRAIGAAVPEEAVATVLVEDLRRTTLD